MMMPMIFYHIKQQDMIINMICVVVVVDHPKPNDHCDYRERANGGSYVEFTILLLFQLDNDFIPPPEEDLIM